MASDISDDALIGDGRTAALVPTRRLIGNFPQALTHLGVVNSALVLSGPVVQRGAV